MNTVERLSEYGVFSNGVIESVSDTHSRIATFQTYQDLFKHVGIQEPEFLKFGGSLPVQMIDIRPEEHNPEEAMMVHLPMANPLDENMLYSLAAISMHFPNTRILASGNPSGRRGTGNGLTKAQRRIVRTGYLEPTVEPLMWYAFGQGIERLHHVGGSLGATKALAAVAMNAIETDRITVMEPADVVPRKLRELATAFASTNGALGEYVEANGLDTFKDARKDALGMIEYSRGFLKPSNIAEASAIARGHFFLYLAAAMGMGVSKALVSWGSASELALDGKMIINTSEFKQNNGDRFTSLRIPGAKHASLNDLALQNAIIATSLAV